MPRRKQLAITERQFEVLNLLWDGGPLTVREVRERLQRPEELPYTTVLGLLQVMERAGLVAHELENQTHRYRPLLSRTQGTSELLTDFVRRFFRGAAERLVLGLVDARQLSAEDLRELEQRLTEPSAKDVSFAPDEVPAPEKTHSPKKRRGKKLNKAKQTRSHRE